MEKSANKIWKEYVSEGGTLSFKEWIDRENKKKEGMDNFLPFDATQSVKDTINETLIQAKKDANVTSVYKTDSSKFLGLDKKILVFSSFIILGSIGFLLYKKYKKNER